MDQETERINDSPQEDTKEADEVALTNEEEIFSLNDLIVFYLKIFSGLFVLLLSRYFQKLLNISFLGLTYDNPHMLDAVGLVHLYSFVVLLSFCFVNINTLDLIGSKAYGKKNYFLYGVILHRTFLMSFFMFAILYIINIFSGAKIMLLLYMDIRQYEYFDEYLKYYQLSFLFECTHSILIRYLNIIGKSHIGVFIMIITLVLHIVFSYTFIYVLDLVVAGAGLALICTNLCNVILELSYILIFKPSPESFFFFTRESFSLQGISDYMKVYWALFPITMSWSASSEIQMIVASTLGKFNLAAHVILGSISDMSLSISYGSCFSTAIAVGYFLGKNDVKIIKRILYVAWSTAIILITLLVIVLVSLRIFIINSFLSNPFIIEMAFKCFPLLCVYLLLQAFNDTFYGWFRSVGQRTVSIVVSLFSYFVFYITIVLVLTKVLHFNVFGIWISNVPVEIFSITVLLIFFFVLDIKESCRELIKTQDEEDKSRGEHMEIEDKNVNNTNKGNFEKESNNTLPKNKLL